MERRKVIEASYKQLKAARQVLIAAEEGYKMSLEELWQSETMMKSANNEISTLTITVENLNTSLHTLQNRPVEEPRVCAVEHVKKDHEDFLNDVEARNHKLLGHK